MVSVVRRAACKKLSRAWRACVTLRSAMLRISSGTWKFIRPAPWVSPAMVSPPWNGGPSEPIPADPGRSAAAWKERGIAPKRSTVARHCGPDHGRAALALGSLALAAFGQLVEMDAKSDTRIQRETGSAVAVRRITAWAVCRWNARGLVLVRRIPQA